MRGSLVLAAAIVLALQAPLASQTRNLIETPGLAEQIAAGVVPPVSRRVPDEPLIANLTTRGREPGLHGGTMRMFVTRSKAVRYMAAYGYARLVAYDSHYNLVPDILRRVEVATPPSP